MHCTHTRTHGHTHTRAPQTHTHTHTHKIHTHGHTLAHTYHTLTYTHARMHIYTHARTYANKHRYDLNECLLCDELHCSPTFVGKCGGANRRTAGALSSIARPLSEVCAAAANAAVVRGEDVEKLPGATTTRAEAASPAAAVEL
jgi:hypothetical protein